jgi:hypothetical protein
MANEKPCLTCTTVADPEKCENKNCKAWREWFLKKWDELRCSGLRCKEVRR